MQIEYCASISITIYCTFCIISMETYSMIKTFASGKNKLTNSYEKYSFLLESLRQITASRFALNNDFKCSLMETLMI